MVKLGIQILEWITLLVGFTFTVDDRSGLWERRICERVYIVVSSTNRRGCLLFPS